MLNYERIRQMNVDELAGFLDDFDCKYCGFSDQRNVHCTVLHNNIPCTDGIKNWLLKEVEDDGRQS